MRIIGIEEREVELERIVLAEVRRESTVLESVIEDAESAANDELGSRLIGEAKTWPESPRIILRELAIAGGFIDDAAGMAARVRIWCSRGKIPKEAVFFPLIGRVVVT